jgi:SnoaL-like domain
MTEEHDRWALRDLVDGYAVAVDERDQAAFVALFTPDAQLTTFDADGRASRTYTGHDDLAAIPVALARYDRTLHLVSTHRVTVDGDHAVGTAYCEAHHLRTAADSTYRSDRVLFIRYDDRYARRGSGWLIVAREVHIRWSEERSLP